MKYNHGDFSIISPWYNKSVKEQKRTPFYSYCYLLRVNVKKILKKNYLRVQALKKGEK